MISRRELLRGGAALAASSLLIDPAKAFIPSSAVRLTLLHTNDVHSHMEPAAAGPFKGFGGAPARSSFIKLARMKHRNVLVLDAGDMFQGTPYYNLYNGEVELRAMSEMGYDAGTVGNHEFDAGVEVLAEMVDKHARFPLLNCNYDFSNTAMKGKTRESMIVEKDGLRIGLLGLGIRLEGLVSARHFGDTVFLDPVEHASRVAKVLRHDERCDFIIALSHINLLPRADTPRNDPGDRDLIREVPEIDLVIGGHNHYLLERPESVWRGRNDKMGYVAQTGWGGTHIGFLQFDIFGRGQRELSAAEPVLMNAQA